MKKKNSKHSKHKGYQKQPFNMYAWGQKNKKLFASIISLILVVGLLLSLVQL